MIASSSFFTFIQLRCVVIFMTDLVCLFALTRCGYARIVRSLLAAGAKPSIVNQVCVL